MASVRRRDNGLFEIRFHDSGRPNSSKSIYIRARNTRSAERVASKLEEDRIKGDYDPWVSTSLKDTDALTVAQAKKKYLAHVERTLRAKTVQEKRYVLKLWADGIKFEGAIEKLAPKDIVKPILERDITDTSKNTYLRVIQTFFNWLHRQGYLSVEVKLPLPEPESKEVAFLLEKDMWEIADAITPRWMNRVVRFAFYSGARLREIEHVRHKDVNLELGYIRVGHEGFEAKTNASFRTIPIIPPILSTFEDVFEKGSDKPLFGHTYYNRVSRHFRLTRKKLFPHEENVNFHSLRHSCAIYYLSQDITLYKVSKLLGHSSSKVTEKYYADIIPTSLRNSMEKVRYMRE